MSSSTRALGALPEQREFVFEPGATTPVGPSEADLLLGSAELADYLADHVEVEVRTLVDFHKAYSTAAIGEATDSSRWLYTADDPVHT